MVSKRFQIYVSVNWNTGRSKVYKRAPKKVGPYEIPVKLDILFDIPDQPEIIFQKKIEVPIKKVMEMSAEAL